MNVGSKFAWTACMLAVALVALCASSPIRAASIFVPEDQSLFELVITPGGQTVTHDGSEVETRELTENELQALAVGTQYWANMLGAVAQNTSPLDIQVFGDTIENATAESITDHDTGWTVLARALLEGSVVADTGYLAIIEIGSGLTYSEDVRLWALPRSGDSYSLASIMVHELTHALGMIANFDEHHTNADDLTTYSFNFVDYPEIFVEHMHDAFGTKGEAGMSIKFVSKTDYENLNTNPGMRDANTFYLVYSDSPNEHSKGLRTGAYFLGQHVSEVLNGAEISFPEDYFSVVMGVSFPDKVPGLPLNGMEISIDDTGEVVYTLGQMPHVELQNSLLSHQEWRNWGILMEAELAMLQDLGYEIDRRQYFGYSIYNDGLSDFVNNNPYYKRVDGQWVVGEPNETAWGIGLHVYGSSNTITQAADILTVGYDATGIRLEGVGNTLTVAEGTSVRSDGQYGTGLLVSYGKEHVVNVEGTVTALGGEGVAARFDFGDNAMSNSTEYRGSYMWSFEGIIMWSYEGIIPEYMLEKINGPLVSSFNVSGTLMGAAKAIYIAENAYVETINILSGAYLQGDIVSDWNPGNELLHTDLQNTLFTTLSFGNTLSEDGTLVGDSNFSLVYSGNISGAASIKMKLDGGTLVLGGTADVYSLSMDDGTTLALVGSDTSSPQVTTEANVAIGDNATLHTGFTANGAVTGIKAGTAVEIGNGVTWTFAALPDFYASNSQIVLDAPVTGASSVTAASFQYHTLLDSSSPTLDFAQQSSTTGAKDAIVEVSRAENAYSQYAGNRTSYKVGNALYQIAEVASGDMGELLKALDWSGPDGSGVTQGLAQLGPDAYDAVARATLAEQNEFNLLVLRRMLARLARQNATAGSMGASGESSSAGDSTSVKKASDWEIWATPYGGGAFQGTHGGLSSWKSTGVGLLLGADRYFDSGLSVGGHVALAARRTHVDDGQDARADTKSAFVGLQAFFAPESWDGAYLTGQGRLGIESGDMEREIHIDSYHRSTEARWSGFAGSLMLGGGKDFTVRMAESSATFGPLAWFEYAFLNRPSFSEKDGEAARLRLGRGVYDSLLMNLGAHAGWQTTLGNGSVLGFDVLAAWRHELLDGKFATSAHLAGYGAYGFDSESELPGRDSMLVQGGIRLAGTSGFSANLEAGVELFRVDYTAFNVGLNLAWEF